MQQDIPNFARMREWIEPDGVHWHRRGDQVLSGKNLARRLRQPQVHVVHHYMGELTDVPGTDRDSFWAAAEARMRASAQSRFRGVEFRSDSGDRLLVVEEDC